MPPFDPRVYIKMMFYSIVFILVCTYLFANENGDFVCSSPNDGTHYFRPVTARAHTFWQKQNYNRFVVDNNEDYYIVKSVDSEKICNEIRQNNMDFTS